MNRFRVALHIVPRRGILDPQGKAVAGALQTLGFNSVEDVHVGRHVIVELMGELNRDLGTTLVLVTHDPDLASRAGRTIRLADGAIVSDSGRGAPVGA